MTDFDVQAVDLSGILNKGAEEKAKQVPDPSTYHLLCALKAVVRLYWAGEGSTTHEILTCELRLGALSACRQPGLSETPGTPE